MANCEESSTVLVTLPSNVTPLTTYYKDQVDDCYVVGRVSFTAGVSSCQQYQVVQDKILEAKFTNDEAMTVMADPMAYYAFHLMLDAMYDIMLMNISTVPTWNNLEGYTRSIM